MLRETEIRESEIRNIINRQITEWTEEVGTKGVLDEDEVEQLMDYLLGIYIEDNEDNVEYIQSVVITAMQFKYYSDRRGSNFGFTPDAIFLEYWDTNVDGEEDGADGYYKTVLRYTDGWYLVNHLQ